MSKRNQSAYFHFLNSCRNEVKKANPGLKLGAMQKLLSEKWKSLNDDEKQKYIKMAVEDKERYDKEKLSLKQEDVEPENGSISENETADTIRFPIARIKKLITTNPDIQKVSSDAVIGIGKATEVFLEYLGNRSQANAILQKRKTIKKNDVIEVIHQLPVLEWLRFDIPFEKNDMSTIKKSIKVTKTTNDDLPVGHNDIDGNEIEGNETNMLDDETKETKKKNIRKSKNIKEKHEEDISNKRQRLRITDFFTESESR